MKNVVVATALCLLGLTAPSPAHAAGGGYGGRCRLMTINDTTPGGALGGQTVWNGEVSLDVVASTPGDTITAASCAIKINSSGTESEILQPSTPLPAPVAVGAGRVTFTADITDTVYVCTRVTTTTGGAEDQCVGPTTSSDPLGCIDDGILGASCVWGVL